MMRKYVHLAHCDILRASKKIDIALKYVCSRSWQLYGAWTSGANRRRDPQNDSFILGSYLDLCNQKIIHAAAMA